MVFPMGFSWSTNGGFSTSEMFTLGITTGCIFRPSKYVGQRMLRQNGG